jgi:dihydropteroate synthase
MIAALNGATIIRAHDVAATVDAVRVAAALKR